MADDLVARVRARLEAIAEAQPVNEAEEPPSQAEMDLLSHIADLAALCSKVDQQTREIERLRAMLADANGVLRWWGK